MTNFPTNLRYLREEHKLSQQQIADSLGLKQRTYSHYETGNSEPSLEILTKLAKFFRVSLDTLVGYAFDITAITPKEKEELAHIRKIQQKTGLDNIDVVVEGVKHIPEAVKAKKEKREAQPQTEKLKKMREASHDIKANNE